MKSKNADPDALISAYVLKEDAAVARLGEHRYGQELALGWIARNPAGPWDEMTWEIIRESEGEEWFFRAVAEAIRKGPRKPLLADAEHLLLENWTEVKIRREKFPGLQVWTWPAIVEFLDVIHGHASTPEAVRKMALRAGLKQSRPTLVRGIAKVGKRFCISEKGGQKTYA